MAAFIKNLSRFLGGSGKAPSLHLAAFGKHPGWNDHLDDIGLDTEALITAKRLLYSQGISQNIDSGAWEYLEPTPANSPRTAIGRLDHFRHELLWNMPSSILLAGRFWSSTDGKGRDKYPMVICSQLTELSDRFATQLVMPLLKRVHDRCTHAATADDVGKIIDGEREHLQAHLKDSVPPEPMTANQLAAIANHPDMKTAEVPSTHAHHKSRGIDGGGGGEEGADSIASCMFSPMP